MARIPRRDLIGTDDEVGGYHCVQRSMHGATGNPLELRTRFAYRDGTGHQTWAMLINRAYEFAPLACPRCGGPMKVIAFIEPPQADVIEKILRHCGLWCPPSPRAPPGGDGSVHDAACSDEPRELPSWRKPHSGRPADFPRRTSDARAVRALAGFRV